MKIGYTLSRMRLPALVDGDIVNLDLTTFHGQWTIFCVLSRLSILEARFLQQQAPQFIQQNATLAGFIPDAFPFRDGRIKAIRPLSLPFLADPLGKVSRAFSLVSPRDPDKCQSIIFDPKGTVRYHLIHELNGRGMAFVMEMLVQCQTPTVQRTPETSTFFAPHTVPLSLAT